MVGFKLVFYIKHKHKDSDEEHKTLSVVDKTPAPKAMVRSQGAGNTLLSVFYKSISSDCNLNELSKNWENAKC